MSSKVCMDLDLYRILAQVKKKKRNRVLDKQAKLKIRKIRKRSKEI
jgi:hypothetical protein